MSKIAKRNSSFIDDPQRCEICSTSLTLYPKDFIPCPCCKRTICRQCWGESWTNKSFPSEKCAHLNENEGLSSGMMAQRGQEFGWDWYKIAFAGVLILLAIGILIFLTGLFT